MYNVATSDGDVTINDRLVSLAYGHGHMFITYAVSLLPRGASYFGVALK